MTERLRRAIARKKFFDGSRKWSKLSRQSNSFGNPIGKPLDVRSLRRYLRAERKLTLKMCGDRTFLSKSTGRAVLTGRGFQGLLSSTHAARTVRYLNREGKYAV